MATSGILVIAKSKDVHEHLQKQFLSKEIQKEYTAVLEGHVTDNSGIIDLPLRTDFEDRPRQMVCYDYGKSSQTKYEVQSRNQNETIVKFQPFTGRTHQLRVHAAHIDGLNTAIKGDDLYGKPSDRLFLHASKLEFTHPVKLSKQIVYCPVNW
jgi:tRNA pseudouridine32 synthase/23S rRNA pseudouridine746 synthase